MKIWFFGKVYDDGISAADIEKDIEARLREYTDTGIGVCLTVEDDGYSVMLHRTLNVEPKDGCILEADTFLISGEGYSRDMPEYRDIGDPGMWRLFTHYFDLPEFEKACKRTIEQQTGQRVESVTVTEYINLLSLEVKFG
jgi:hypothetical protein